MKRILTIAIVLLYAATSAFSQTLTAADRDRALQYLENTKQAVLNATAGLSDAQWNFKSAPDRWSIAEVMEHIAAAEDFLMGMVDYPGHEDGHHDVDPSRQESKNYSLTNVEKAP